MESPRTPAAQTGRAIAPYNLFEFFAFEFFRVWCEFPVIVRSPLGYLHPLLSAPKKSPARKYRRRRGNGGPTEGQRREQIRRRGHRE
ncbi:MAG: hypothetical protein DMG51_20510 [Acidobacteria bacterium]|nr:MAG: hypothetical protein DMG51_20510 [Acidobacteriota bacterium]